MAEGIYIYAETEDGAAESYTAGLVNAAKSLGLSEPLTVFAFGDESLKGSLSWDGVSAVVIDDKGSSVFEDDVRAQMAAQFIKEMEPAIVLIPATVTAKSLFSRAAVILDIGLTADCTKIYMEDGKFKQSKPAFGDAIAVTEEMSVPAVVSVVAGIYPEEPAGTASDFSVYEADLPLKNSGVEFTEIVPLKTESIINAEHIISLGRGSLTDGGFETAKELAKAMGAAVGGTRPLVDKGLMAFEQQIGQSGFTVHPKSCIFFGVSGAIQHTEGVRDTAVTIAVNTDPDAAIFSFADYGAAADAKEVMEAMLKGINNAG